jgi:hypothetical protein
MAGIAFICGAYESADWCFGSASRSGVHGWTLHASVQGCNKEIGVIKRYSDIFLVVLFLDTSVCSSLRHKSQYEEPWS